ncbi:hypothetical protein AVEN_21262-1 [Araneus ventricosus]|uniref:Uncharacterized protein n=1 Tax=Araneus ventricosus TaxID=182803 RepID=A0A4Y2NWE3_ARAVE|nr:hypothetical protein AVEN_21262-1 [Araneus ventricosus]
MYLKAITSSVAEKQCVIKVFRDYIRCRGGLVVRSQPRDQRVAGSKPDSPEAPPYMGPAARQIIRNGQTLSRWCGAEAWRGGASPGVVLVT